MWRHVVRSVVLCWPWKNLLALPGIIIDMPFVMASKFGLPTLSDSGRMPEVDDDRRAFCYIAAHLRDVEAHRFSWPLPRAGTIHR